MKDRRHAYFLCGDVDSYFIRMHTRAALSSSSEQARPRDRRQAVLWASRVLSLKLMYSSGLDRILAGMARLLFAKFIDSVLVSCQPYLMNRRDDDLRMFGWYFVAAVDNDLLTMARETNQFRL